MSARTAANPIGLASPLVGGLIVGVGIGAILAYLASLPFMLGLFFFLLFGLVIGAAMFRLGQASRPAPRAAVWTIGLLVTLVTWSTTIVVEYAGLSEDVAQEVIQSLPHRVTGEDEARVHAEMKRFVLGQFLGRPSEGTVMDQVLALPGYVKWVVTDGTLECPRVITADSIHSLELNQRRFGWLFRVVLSLGLLGFAVCSQVLELARPQDASDVDRDDNGQTGSSPESV